MCGIHHCCSRPTGERSSKPSCVARISTNYSTEFFVLPINSPITDNRISIMHFVVFNAAPKASRSLGNKVVERRVSENEKGGEGRVVIQRGGWRRSNRAVGVFSLDASQSVIVM